MGIKAVSARRQQRVGTPDERGYVEVQMSGGFFYGEAEAVKRVPEGLMTTDVVRYGPYDTARQAEEPAHGRVTDAFYEGAYTKRLMEVGRKTGVLGPAPALEPGAIERKYASAPPLGIAGGSMTLSGASFATGMDPLETFRYAAAQRLVDADDVRQLAAAASHPDPEKRVELPLGYHGSLESLRRDGPKEVRLKAAAFLALAADKSISRSSLAERLESYGMNMMKDGPANASLALGFLVPAMEKTREAIEIQQHTPVLATRSKRSREDDSSTFGAR